MALDLFCPQSFMRSGGKKKTLPRTKRFATGSKVGPVRSLNDVSGIEFRMLPPFIIDNHTSPVWPFPGFSKLYCITIVISDVTNQLVGAIDIKGFPRIGDHEYLPVNKTLFYWQAQKDSDKSPDQIHVMCSLVKCKQSLRNVGKIMSELKDDNEYQSAISALGKIAKNAAKMNIVADLITQIGALVGKHLGKVDDKPIGTILNSYTTLHGDFDQPGVKKLVYFTKDVTFNFDLTVRNKKADALIQDAFKINVFENKSSNNFSVEGEESDIEVDMIEL